MASRIPAVFLRRRYRPRRQLCEPWAASPDARAAHAPAAPAQAQAQAALDQAQAALDQADRIVSNTLMSGIVAVILAGGQARRLGGVDKALLSLGGRTLLARALACVAPRVDGVALSANGAPARFAPYGLTVLQDAQPGLGPLSGVLAGLVWARARGAAALLSLPVDTPFAPPDLVMRLAPAPAVACWQGRQHHLVALWPVSFTASLAGMLAADGKHRVSDALALCGARAVEFDAADDPFLNINTPDELRRAEDRLRAGDCLPRQPA